MPFGPNTPNHVVESKPGTVSATVGRSGSSGERCADVTASARSLPSFRCGIAEAMLSNRMWIWPVTMSGTTSAVPRYGMCTM
jgi:hypothetical protein